MAVLTACLSTGQNAMPTWVVLPLPGVWSGHTEGWSASGKKEISEEKPVCLCVLWRMKWNHHYVHGGTEGNASCTAITVKRFLRLSEWRHGKLAPDREDWKKLAARGLAGILVTRIPSVTMHTISITWSRCVKAYMWQRRCGNGDLVTGTPQQGVLSSQ